MQHLQVLISVRKHSQDERYVFVEAEMDAVQPSELGLLKRHVGSKTDDHLKVQSVRES